MDTGRNIIVLLICRALSLATCFSVRKGVLWLLIATVAEVPPAVNLACSPVHPVSLITMQTSQVLIILNLNGIVYFLSVPPMKSSRLNSILRYILAPFNLVRS